MDDEQISNSVSKWARLGHGQYECEMSTKRNACPNHASTSGTSSSKQGRKSLDDDECEGIPPITARSDNTIAHVRSITCTDRHITADAVAEKLGVSHGTCHRILHKPHVCPHGSKNRTEDELNETAAIRGDVISMADSELKMLDRIITGDEIWCYIYDPQTRQHSHHTGSS